MRNKLKDRVTRAQDLLYSCKLSLVTTVLGPLVIYAIYSVILFAKSMISGNAFWTALAEVGEVYYTNGHLSTLIALTLTVMAGVFGLFLFFTLVVLLWLGICKIRLRCCS